MSQGDTPEEAMDMIVDAMQGWMEVNWRLALHPRTAAMMNIPVSSLCAFLNLCTAKWRSEL